MERSTTSKSPFGGISPDVYKEIFVQAAEINDKFLAIQNIRDLPKNGNPRSNRFLAGLLTLDKDVQQHLEYMTWKALGIFTVDYLVSKKKGWGGFHYDYDNPKDLQIRLKEFYERFEANKRHIKSLELVLVQWIDLAQTLLPHAIKIFESVRPDQIEQVHIHLTNLYLSDHEGVTASVLLPSIEKLLAPIHNFKNLLSIRITSEPNKGRIEFGWLAATFRALPIVESIGLYRRKEFIDEMMDIGNIGEEWNADGDDEFGHGELGEALSSRPYLKTLNLYNFTGPSLSWLEMDWIAPLEELTIMLKPWRMHLEEDFDEEEALITPVVEFLKIFHRTLVSLHLTDSTNDNCDDSSQFARSGDKEAAGQFKSLKHVTWEGTFCPLTALYFPALLPSVESLYIIGFQKWFFKNTVRQSNEGPWWVSLKEVFQSEIQVKYKKEKTYLESIKDYCKRHSIKHSMASLKPYLMSEIDPEKDITGARQPEFCYPQLGFLSRLGLNRQNRDTVESVTEPAQSTSGNPVDITEPLSDLSLS